MALTETAKRKAATVLMSLDSGTASELLKEFSPDEIQQLAMEMVQIETSGRRNKKEEAKIIQEFCGTLRKSQKPGLSVRSFLNETLAKILDKDKAEEIQSQIRKATEKKDIFEPVRSANTDELVLALESEHPQTVAVVLSELKLNKVREILSRLDQEFCCNVVWKMANPAQLGPGVKQRMASVLAERLKSFKGITLVAKPETTLREVAIMLSDIQRDLRSQILDKINERDEKTGTMIRNLMITWEDIPTIADRSLQESLRTIESQNLAVALYQADEEITRKIRSNISERAGTTLDEEAMLMQEPLEEEILNAREEVVQPLRKANEEGTLRRSKQ